MFDHVLTSYLKPDSIRILPKLRQAVDGLTTYVDQIITRYDSAYGTETAGMQVLEQIIGDTDVSSLRSYRDDYDRYLLYLNPIKEDMVRPIDAGAHGPYCFGNFVTQNAGSRAYLFPINCSDYIRQLPMGQDWESWKDLRPLRLLYNDSPDLSLNAYLDRLYYSKHPPTHVVLGLDGVMLLMQYAKYLDTHPPDEQLPLVSYLHEYVIYPALLQDSVTTWLVTQYNAVLNYASNDQPNPKFKPLSTPILGNFGSQFPAAMEDVWTLGYDAQNNTLSPTRCLSSLLTCEGSLSQTYRTLNRHIDIPPLRQCYWMRYLALMGWRRLVFTVIALTKTHPMTQSVCVSIKRDYKLLYASRFWMGIPDPQTRDYIEADLNNNVLILETIK